MTSLGPRVVIAGAASGVGKTTVATGLVAALRRRGVDVAAAKVGPDFIDPGYHSLACGRPPRNLDPWLCGSEAIPALAGRAAAGADLLVVEGVMGLFDGAVDGTPSSTADVAALLGAPVVLVVDASSVSASVAAVVRGFRDHDPRVRIAGVICNQVGSDVHEQLVREAIEPLGVPVLGCLRRDDALVWRDRHLGLVPVAEEPERVGASLDRLGASIADQLDVEAVVAVARSAEPRAVDGVRLPSPLGACRVAVAAGRAFTFGYEDNLDALAAAGAEVVPFDPLHDDRLPEAIDGLVVGGGFPEVFGEQLSANAPLLDDARRRIGAGLATWAECGGLLWLAQELDGRPMVGAVPTRARLGERLHLGYRHAEATTDTVIGPAGTTLRGHEFHHSTCEPAGDALRFTSRFGERTDGFASPTLLATYLHHHAGGDPAIIEGFVRRCLNPRRPTADR
ncbi:MAG: cobyrinate a,c-diamide synthase [Acidimicrobiia bacterium]